jgi:hypothetical protein
MRPSLRRLQYPHPSRAFRSAFRQHQFFLLTFSRTDSAHVLSASLRFQRAQTEYACAYMLAARG